MMSRAKMLRAPMSFSRSMMSETSLISTMEETEICGNQQATATATTSLSFVLEVMPRACPLTHEFPVLQPQY